MPTNRWHNWAGNQQCAPAAVASPSSVEELCALVKTAATAGRRVKVVGTGHSFTDIACTSGVQVRLDDYGRVLQVDCDRRQVTVQAGITIRRLNDELAQRGLALPNLGDIGYQTISGAISTSTHGTGAALGGLATQLAGFDLVTADGSVATCSSSEEAEAFAAGRVGLGALGILSTVTLQCVDAFHLRAQEGPMRMDDVVDGLDELVDGNDHFEFYWVPHTHWALTKRNNRTDAPIGGRSRWREFYERVVLENIAFGAACRAGRFRPEWIPRLARLVPGSGQTEYVERSDRVFTSPRFVHFYEMEYSIPRAAARRALTELQAFVAEAGLLLSFPVEVRFTAADDIPLSTGTGEPRCYIAVHVYQGMPYEQYFRGVEAIMDGLGGRPHWGKLHYQTAATLAPRYPEWNRFQALRDRLDPDRRFANAYTERVLGP